ncbi:MAG TPA: sulfide/dihydroorotate dehydrogenase-like FAD/NAD-binding protein [Phycisphaerae bacterium]|jgi:ferredoxin--NADP+ reductase|nr:sulfide/dihydroorotate dehydrogenase-like FAD/NAD-binding protein [Phycisphaerae bacterium]HOJ56378.1 sulfide/dihydroorotate dehydrogenase-like FAD/NAD-binding protein [Phycisphaerae bacterium]HOL26312.1 sulfide/dihydroorotate dehydrogenase-like FAD/NAD-binding protein [Phycisphaerae bacterium]HPP20732.1 sulfide/dihydroorotate dehydrogenase-like FAD/NAD-binding protein [Phycisphaerae bacterium]HQE44494.1 sulfide/dihydroorotate dehydrogenase-like FAD/NAD-binding protein [Phycisphaerae bacteri
MSTGHEIVASQWLAPAVRRLVVRAPHVTRHCGPGQFVIVRAVPDGERIPLTIARSDRSAGTIDLIVQAVGASTRQICALEKGQSLCDVAGPLGRKTEMENVGHAVVVGGGVGTAVIYPQAAGLKACGNYVSAIMGGRTREYVILEKELGEICDAVYPCTDDGSYGFKGFVTDRLKQLIEAAERPVKAVFAAGPVPMMRAVAELTRPYGIHTVASLNPIMVDGTGMCGGCRVQVGGEMKFACVDGPEFDAHQVDFRELTDRLGAYRAHEQAAMERHQCRLTAGLPGR